VTAAPLGRTAANAPPDPREVAVAVHRSVPLVCPYLDGRIERRLVIELTSELADLGLFDELTRAGFRRSHGMMYRPACPSCVACVPVRVPVASFVRRRTQARIWRANADLAAESQLPPRATTEQFDLFQRYQSNRHQGGEMAQMDPNDYAALIGDSVVDTRLVEFRDEGGRLVACGLYDVTDDGLSAVYSFFDPAAKRRSLGTHLVLWLIEEARRLRLPHLYLGYWIDACRKMTYKRRFAPLEHLTRDGWRPLEG
jgi:arginine-tRNA-protein transferase